MCDTDTVGVPVTSRMVAFLLADHGEGQPTSSYWTSGRQAPSDKRSKGTANKAKPREGASTAWREALRDVLDALELGHVIEALKPPSTLGSSVS